MYLVLWVERAPHWRKSHVFPVKLSIEREPDRLTVLMNGRTQETYVVASIDGPDDVAEHAIRFLLLPLMTRALLEPWPEFPVDGAAAVAELVRRAGARP